MAPALFRSSYNIPANVQIFGPWTGVLDTNGNSIHIRKPGLAEAPDPTVPYYLEDWAHYSNAAPWPAQAGANGSSLARRRGVTPGARYGDDPANWGWDDTAGTPGQPNFAPDCGAAEQQPVLCPRKRPAARSVQHHPARRDAVEDLPDHRCVVADVCRRVGQRHAGPRHRSARRAGPHRRRRKRHDPDSRRHAQLRLGPGQWDDGCAARRWRKHDRQPGGVAASQLAVAERRPAESHQRLGGIPAQRLARNCRRGHAGRVRQRSDRGLPG